MSRASLSVVLLLLANIVLAAPSPQYDTSQQGTSSQSTGSNLDSNTYSTYSSTSDDTVSSGVSTSRSTLYFVALAIAVVLFFVGAAFYHRRVRQRKALRSQGLRNTVSRDMEAMSAEHRGLQSRTLSGPDSVMLRSYGGQGRVETSGRVDQDGMRLDVDESGDAPPPYIKEVYGSSVKAPEGRHSTVSTLDGREAEAVEERDVRMDNNNTSVSALPDYEELHGEGLRRPEPVHRATSSNER